jgi:hypothetical protein
MGGSMPKYRRALIATVILLLSITWTMPLHAADSSLKVVFEDSLYGGLVGALVGSATLAFTHKASDHLDNITYGAAAGVIAGAGIGIFTSVRHAMVEYENGRVKLGMPTVLPDIQESSRGQLVLAVKADLLRGTF